jgi:hypothetical protein
MPFLRVIALATMLAAEGTILPVAAVFVRTPPPHPIAVRPVGRRPGPGWVWTGGYWRWVGGTRGYAWVPGRWRRPPRAGAVWVSPRWRRSRGGYTFVAGGWR